MSPSRRLRMTVVATALSLPLIWAAPAQAAQAPLPAPASSTVGEPDPVPPATTESVEPGESVPTSPLPAVAPAVVAAAPTPEDRTPRYPDPGVATQSVTAAPPAADATDAARPVRVTASSAASGAPSSVAVDVLDQDAVERLGGIGLAFTVTRIDGVATAGPVDVTALYDGFRYAAGGNLASRLALVALPACALTTPALAGCMTRTPVATANDVASGVLHASVTAAARPSAALGLRGGAVEGVVAGTAPAGQVFVVVSTPISSLGDYAATPISPTGQWSVGIGAGDFTWSEDMPSVPLPEGGQGAGPALTYSSGSVDGRTTAKNPQASWAGIGWELQSGSIDQAFQSCVDAGHPQFDSDSCVYEGVGKYTITLNGQSSALVPVAGVANAYRLRDDPGWQVQYDAVRGSWTVFTPDGTRYYFGYASTTSSKWTMPVNNGSGGYLTLPWRWALSNVRDTSNNMVAYYYATESNYFLADDGLNKSYMRAGRLKRIEFGRVFDDVEAANLETGALDFVATYRCDAADRVCPSAPSEATADQFPDVPVDLICLGGSTPCEETSPTFFTDYKLSSVTSTVKSAVGMEPVDKVTYLHSLLDARAGDDADKGLWLDQIQSTGLDGASADVLLPPTSFTGVALNSRADAIESYALRVNKVSQSTGATVSVTYSQPTPCPPDDLVEIAENGDWDCFVDIGRRDSSDVGYVWYRKWLVTTAVTTPVLGVQDPPISQTSTYQYVGTPQVHHDSYAVSADDLTFSIYRGYGEVKVTTGTGIDVYKVFRGMHLDRDTDFPDDLDTTTFDNLPNAAGLDLDDWDWLKSRQYEHARYDGTRLVEVTTTGPGWAPRAPPPAMPPNYDGSASKMVVDASVTTIVDVPAGTDRVTKTTYSYDSDGLPTGSVEYGDTSGLVTNDDRCTTISYAKNTDAWVLVPSTEIVRPGLNCSVTPWVSMTKTLYDGLAWGVAPTRGLPTEIQSYDTTSTFSSTKIGYDVRGRVTSATDANGNTTTTKYEPSDPAVGLPDKTTVTNALGHVTKTTLHPLRRLPTTTTDANSHVTTAAYDAVGRLAKVWLPDQAVTGPASMEYLYDLSLTKTTPPKVTTRVLQQTGRPEIYLSTYEYFDGLGRLRQTQVVAPDGDGRILTDQRYDNRGLLVAESVPFHAADAPGSGMVAVSPADIPSETRYIYDPLGRVITSATYADGAAEPGMDTTTTFNGTSTTVTPARGFATTTYFDAYARTTKIVEHNTPTEWTTSYSYDLRDNLTKITDQVGNVTTYTYDMLNRRTASSDPDTGAWSYTYDKAGNRLKTTDAKSKSTVAVYDKLNRQTELHKDSKTGTLLSSWTYDTGDRKGLLVTSTSRVDGWDYKVSDRTYDARDRLTSKTYVVPASPAATGLDGSYKFEYGYDPADHLTSTKYPAAGGLSAETVTSTFSIRGYEVSTTGSVTYVASTTYKNYGLLARRDYGGTGDLTRKYSYDGVTRWLDNLTTEFDGDTIQDSAITHDLVGNVTSILTSGDTTPNECFKYDLGNRLTQAVTRTGTGCTGPLGGEDGYNQTFNYDGAARITSRSTVDGPAGARDEYRYAGSKHAVQSTVHFGGSQPPDDPPPSMTYGYDANGRRISSDTGPNVVDAVSVDHTWDEQHRLSKTVVDGDGPAETSTYIYDADGVRLIRNDPSGRVLYLDDTEITAGADQPSVRYYKTAGGVSVGLRAAGQGWSRVVLNHQGSTQYVIPNGGTDVQHVEYEPYGATRTDVDDLPTDRQYLQAPTDKQTGLIQIGARYYDAGLAQFISPDPLVAPYESQALNAYTNAFNNPVSYTDPTGLFPICGLDPGDCGPGQDQDNPTSPPPGGGGDSGGSGGCSSCGGSDDVQSPADTVETTLEIIPWCSGFWGCAWDMGWEVVAADFVDCGTDLQASSCGWAAASVFPVKNLLKLKVLTRVGDTVDEAQLLKHLGLGASGAVDGLDVAKAILKDRADDVFLSNGGLRSAVIDNSKPIIRGTDLNNPKVTSLLTRDGSSLSDWAKYKSPVYTSDLGRVEAHFYHNAKTGRTEYGEDYSVFTRINLDGT